MVRIGASSSEHSLRIQAGIMSGQVAFCGLLFCRSFLTPCSVTMILSMSVKGVQSGSLEWLNLGSLMCKQNDTGD